VSFPYRDGRPMDRDKVLDRVLKPEAKRAGLGNVTLQCFAAPSHRWRRTRLVQDIQARMRHARPDTTAAIYVLPVSAQQAQAVHAYEELIFGETRGTIQ